MEDYSEIENKNKLDNSSTKLFKKYTTRSQKIDLEVKQSLDNASFISLKKDVFLKHKENISINSNPFLEMGFCKKPSLDFQQKIVEIQRSPKCKVCLSGNALSTMLRLLNEKKVNITELFKKKTQHQIESCFLPNTGLKRRKKLPKENEKDILPEKNNLDDENSLYTQIKALIYEIKEKGIIFFRMLPHQKAQLIQLFKDDGHSIVSMCGDGANDSNAITISDVGIAIRQVSNQSLVSHFFSRIDSIICIENIIKNGRACYENTNVILRFMVLNGVIQLGGHLILNIRGYEFSTNQYLFLDFICGVIPIFLATKIGAPSQLSSDAPYESMIDKPFLFVVFGQTVIQIAALLAYTFIMENWIIDISLDGQGDISGELTEIYGTYVFVVCTFQYFSILFVFNLQVSNRKTCRSNKLYTTYMSGILFLFLSIIFMEERKILFSGSRLVLFESETYQFEMRMERNKVFTLLFSLGNFIVTGLYNLMITKLVKKAKI